MSTDPARVLVADDDGDIRDLVTFTLQQVGCTVEPVGDGVQAWESMSTAPPRLAVLDVMMPGLSGLDVLRKLRDDDRTRDVPVIRFARASNATQAQIQGTGLGLAVVTNIIERHGGRIDLARRVGMGTTVRLLLPSSGDSGLDWSDGSDGSPLPRKAVPDAAA